MKFLLNIRLTILDIYIIKKFLGTFIFSIILIIALAIIIDLSEKIDSFIEKQVPINEIIFDHYFNFIPYYTNLFLFLFVFISVVFFTSKMAENSEIISIIGSGISFNRLMYPYFISAFVLAVASFMLSNFIIPPANRIRLDFENTYINGTYYNSDRNIHKQISPGVFIYMENFNTMSNSGNKFSIENFKGNDLKSKLISKRVKWDSTISKWSVFDYFIRDISGNKEVITSGKRIDTFLSITPEDFQRRDTEKSTMDYTELNSFIDDIRLRGETNINTYLLEKHQRTAFPFSTFILTLMGVSLASRKSKGGTGIKMGLGFLLSFLYIFFMQIAAQFSIKGGLSPLLAAWIPNFIFAMVAFFLYRIAPK
ncbi:MAG: LptF/LptG family permease [Bacteroidales bacterium]|nr:LptF/LptG family permease [Bacteroidales bacterium]